MTVASVSLSPVPSLHLAEASVISIRFLASTHGSSLSVQCTALFLLTILISSGIVGGGLCVIDGTHPSRLGARTLTHNMFYTVFNAPTA